jgi:hypothetical protein
MIKQVLFTAAFLVPGLAYGGNPSANLSVQVVPAGKTGTCGTIAGQANTDLAAAGFTTCALYNDFTTPIPNSVGTGLPANWLNCNRDSTPAIWYWTISDRNGGSYNPCSNVIQTTDGSNGLVLDIQSFYSQMAQNGAGVNNNTISTSDYLKQNISGYFPNAYFEATVRYDQSVQGITGGWWSWVWGNGGDLGGGLVEDDFMESRYNETDSALTFWPAATWANPYLVNASRYDRTQYHTWGMLQTGDGNGNFADCTYVDGIRQGCYANSFAGVGVNAAQGAVQRRFLRFDIAPDSWPNNSGVPNFGTLNFYVKSVKVLTCSSYSHNYTDGSSGMCNGTTYNGNFYQ